MKRTTRAIGAMVLVGLVVAGPRPAAQANADVALRAAMETETVKGDLKSAIEQYQKVAQGADRAAAAVALVRMAACYQKLGDGEARVIYERVVREYGDQKEPVGEARVRLAALGPAAVAARPAVRALWSNPPTGSRGPDSASPDGRFAAFTDSQTGDLAIHDFTTGTDRRLTNIGGWAVGYTDGASISPDGQRVAYVVYLDKEKALELRVAPIAGGETTPPVVALRTTFFDGAYEIGWMPDGRQLVVLRNMFDRTSQIGLVSIRDQSFRSIKSLEWRKPNRLAVSPDGRFVAYDVPATEAGSPRDIVVLATDGSREVIAVQNPGNDAFPVWSPDGSQLLFLSDRSGTNSLWAVPMLEGRSAGAPVMLRSDVGLIRLLGMTKQGTLVYFDRPVRPVNLYAAEIDGMRIAVPPAPVTERLVNRNFGAAWSRDGEALAYYSFRDAAFDLETPMLVIRSARTGAERTVTLPARVTGRFGVGPRWFPERRAVLIECEDAEGPGFSFYRVAIDTGNTELVARAPKFARAYDLSVDGKSLFYALTVDDDIKVIRMDFDTGRETELRRRRFEAFPNSWEAVALAVSPDGRQLAMTIIGGAIEIISVDGGPSRTVFAPPQPEMGTGALMNGLTWSPDQQSLLFVRGDGTFWKVPLDGRGAEPMNLSMQGIKSPTVHADGKRLVFNALGAAKPTGIWMLDDVLAQAAAKK